MGRRARRRANGEGTTFKVKSKPGAEPRPKPWAAQIVVGWTLEGRPIRRARYASSEREAKLLLSQMIAARDHARPLPDDRLTVGKFLADWLSRQTHLRVKSREVYTRSVRLLLPHVGGIPLRKLRASQIDTALDAIGGAPNSVARNRAVLSTALKDAIREGHVQTNEAALSRPPKVSRKALPAPDTATVRAVLAELEGHRLHALYVLLAGTGLRIGEALGLRWEDLDGEARSPVEEGPGLGVGRGNGDVRVLPVSAAHGRQDAGPRTLTVRYQLQRIEGELVLTDPKTEDAGRVIHLAPVVSEALRGHKARQNAERLRSGRKWRQADLVFTNAEGQPLADQTAGWVLARACERAGVRHLSCHDFRRFAATSLEDALGREAAQLLLGHTSSAMTERYISVRDSMLARAAGAMQEALG